MGSTSVSSLTSAEVVNDNEGESDLEQTFHRIQLDESSGGGLVAQGDNRDCEDCQ